MKIRQRLFRDLIKVQERTGWQLITKPEINEIKRHWEKDEMIHHVGDRKRPMLWNLAEA